MTTLRFGVTSGDRHAHPWKLRASASRPEAFIACAGTGAFLHFSLHEDAAHSHSRLRLPAEELIIPWETDRADGDVRPLLTIFVSGPVVRLPPPRRSGVVWIDAGQPPSTVAFRLVRVPANAPVSADGLGRVTLTDGTSIVVVPEVPPSAGGVSTRLTDASAGKSPSGELTWVPATGFGTLADGSPYVVETLVPPQLPIHTGRVGFVDPR